MIDNPDETSAPSTSMATSEQTQQPSIRSKGKQAQHDHPNNLQAHPASDPALQLNNPSTVRHRDKLLAACAGGCLMSLLMTPLDVVKTRLQTQSNSSSSSHFDPQSCSCTHRFHQSLPPTGGHLSARSNLFSSARPQIVNRSTACSTPSTCIPYNGSSTISDLLHHHHSRTFQPKLALKSQALPLGVLTTLFQIVKHEGISSLWRGVAPGLLISIPAQAIYMLGYDTLRSSFLTLSLPDKLLESDFKLFYEATLTPLMSGMISRSFIAILFSPLELIRTRLQSTPSVVLGHLEPFDSNSKASINQIKSSRQTFKTILTSVRSSGLGSLYSGLSATLWRDVPFSGIYWSGYEFTKKILSGGKGFGEVDEQSSVQQMAIQSFLAGSLSGAIAATFTNGFDVIKTRRQAQIIAKKPIGTMSLLFQISRQEGISKGLMRGLSLRLAKIMPSCGIMIASYEGLARVFSRY